MMKWVKFRETRKCFERRQITFETIKEKYFNSLWMTTKKLMAGEAERSNRWREYEEYYINIIDGRKTMIFIGRGRVQSERRKEVIKKFKLKLKRKSCGIGVVTIVDHKILFLLWLKK